MEGAGDWIWATDADGTLTFFNPPGAALLGHEDLVGRSLADLTHAEDRDANAAPEGWAGVLRRVHADGSLKTVDTRSVRAGDGWQGIDRDLTAEAPGPRAPRQGRRSSARASPSCAGRWSTGAARSSATSWSATAACSARSRPTS